MGNCTCPIRPGMTYEELRDIAGTTMCTRGEGLHRFGFMCPTLTKALDKAQTARGYHERRAKKLKDVGYTDAQIAQMPRRTKRRSGVVQSNIPQLDLDV